ncbi:hypothetical protein ACLKA7_011986 [Drosophila subpalustris]
MKLRCSSSESESFSFWFVLGLVGRVCCAACTGLGVWGHSASAAPQATHKSCALKAASYCRMHLESTRGSIGRIRNSNGNSNGNGNGNSIDIDIGIIGIIGIGSKHQQQHLELELVLYVSLCILTTNSPAAFPFRSRLRSTWNCRTIPQNIFMIV